MQTFWFLRYQIQNSLLWRRSSSGLFSPIWPSGNISANIWKYRTLSVVMKRFITLVASRIFLVSALEIWHSSSMLQLVAFSLVEPRCDQPMRKSHSTVSSNGPNQTDRNSSTKFHWTYWHRAAYLRQRVQPDWPSFESDATKLFNMSVVCENFTLNFHSGIFRCTLAT